MAKCRPEAVSGTGGASPWVVTKDGAEVSSHTRFDKAVAAASDALEVEPSADVRISGEYEMRWMTPSGSACTPDALADPEPDPEPEPEPEPYDPVFFLHVGTVRGQDAYHDNGDILRIAEGDPLYVRLTELNDSWPEGMTGVRFSRDGVENVESVEPYESPTESEMPWVPSEGEHVITWAIEGTEHSGSLTFYVEHITEEPEPTPEPPPEPASTIEAVMGAPQYADTSVFRPRYLNLHDRWEPVHDERPHEWPRGYYDRGYGLYYGHYWATGDETSLQTGHEWVKLYRDGYVLPNNGGVPGRWCNPEGLAAHYVLTGDTESLRALRLMADSIGSWITRGGNESILDTAWRDGRIQGRAWLSQIMMFAVTGEQKYADLAEVAHTDMLVWFDENGATGRWDSGVLPRDGSDGQNSYCDGMGLFQMCHAILHAFVRHHELVAPVARLDEVLTKTLDNMISLSQATGAFAEFLAGDNPKLSGIPYAQPPATFTGDPLDWSCTSAGGNASAHSAIHLSILCATAFAYGFHYTRHQRFEGFCNLLLDHGLSGSVDWPTTDFNNNKIINQSYLHSWRIPYLLGS